MADELTGDNNWLVEFNSDKQMVSNFASSNFDDVLDYMQPGDSALFTVEIKNSYGSETDWYMTNKVLKSLEDASNTAAGGAYKVSFLKGDEIVDISVKVAHALVEKLKEKEERK